MLDLFVRQHIKSACLTSIGYAPQTLTLELRFRSGALYWYWGVSAQTHAQLLAAASKGRFFTQHIKGCYPFVRLAEPTKK